MTIIIVFKFCNSFFSRKLNRKILKRASQFGVLILSGGNSERMGKPKAFLKINRKTFLEKILEEYQKINSEKIVVVVNKNLVAGLKDYKIEKLEFVKNNSQENGRFYSIKLGLKKMKNLDFCFLQNVDEPFVNNKLLRKILSCKNSNGYTTPVFKGKGGHPVLISKKIISAINKIQKIKKPEDWKNRNLKELLKNFKRTEIETNDRKVLININTQKEYRKYVIK